MSNYLFLDNWVLSKYTQPEYQALFSTFIQHNNYTILLNSLAFTELYNPGWSAAPSEERTARVVAFLIQHQCVIVDPESVFRAEFLTYPEHVQNLPVALDLADIPARQRHDVLLAFLRRDPAFLAQGKDIQQWVEGIARLKAMWLETIDTIIADADAKGTLRRDRNDRFINLADCKEPFLLSLDRRHFEHLSAVEREGLGAHIISLFMSGLAQLPATRLTSLCFWYAYIDIDKAYPMKRQGSDISDFYQMSLIPYCSVFTTDNTMYRLIQRVKNDVSFACTILNQQLLNIRHYWKVFTQKQICLYFPFSNASFDGNYGDHTQLQVLYLQFLRVYSGKYPSQCDSASHQQAHAQRQSLNLTSPD